VTCCFAVVRGLRGSCGGELRGVSSLVRIAIAGVIRLALRGAAGSCCPSGWGGGGGAVVGVRACVGLASGTWHLRGWGETALPNHHRGIVGVSRDLSRAPSASHATEQARLLTGSRPTVAGGSGARFARLLARRACGKATPAGVGLPLVGRVLSTGCVDRFRETPTMGGGGWVSAFLTPTLIGAAFGLLPLGVDVDLASAEHGSAGAGRCFVRPWVMAVTPLCVENPRISCLLPVGSLTGARLAVGGASHPARSCGGPGVPCPLAR